MNLLLVSVDSLRLDHAARASGARVRTPRFDALTRGFAFTESCFSVSSATRPVHATLVTGLYPFEHGVQGQHDQRLRPGAPRLFSRLREAGCRVGLFSEAASIFHGLDFGAPVLDLDLRPGAGLARLRAWLAESAAASRRCLFVHYWSTHTPYGAADGLAMGETLRLLRGGRREVVRDRYRAAVESLFEGGIAPLLEEIDLGAWSVVIFGDHGESWTPEEPYHGKTLRNSVLRVPLWMHVPGGGGGIGAAGEVVSLIDLHETVGAICGLEGAEPGFGRDLTHSSGGGRYCLAEVRPGGDDDAAQGPEHSTAGLRWCVLDHRHKLLGGENGWELVDTWSELPASGEAVSDLAESYRRARLEMRRRSRWGESAEPVSDVDGGAELRRRLRALGYLD